MFKFAISFFFKMSHRLSNELCKFYLRTCSLGCGKDLAIYGPGICVLNIERFKIGDRCSINSNAYINALGGISIGSDVSLSAGCILVSTGLDSKATPFRKKHISKEILIGNNVQIGAGAIVLAGVQIGDNVIIGAGAVVTRNISSNSIAYGSPASPKTKLNQVTV